MLSVLRKGPSLRVQSRDEESSIFRLSLTQAQSRVVVRITGGCGLMSEADAVGLHDLLVPAFDGFSGGMLYGGCRITTLSDPHVVVPSITEIPPMIRHRCPYARVHGIIPRTADFAIDSIGRLLISYNPERDQAAIVHPDQDEVLCVQDGVDEVATWAAEYREVLKITQALRKFANWSSLLVSYNGGRYTGEEIVETASRGWPVLLIKGSGRKTDEYAEDSAFLSAHPNVRVVEKKCALIRQALQELGVVPGFARARQV